MMQTQSSSNALFALLSSLVRLIILGNAVLAIYGFFEIRALLLDNQNNSSFKIEDGTLFVALVLCFPSTLQVSGLTIIDATTNATSPAYVEQDVQCRQLDYLINACAASLLIACAAGVVFVFCDFWVRFRCCSLVEMNSSPALAIFLAFILGQTGIVIGALAEQNHLWVKNFKESVEERGLDLDVESHASAIVLFGCSFSCLAVGLLVLVDAALSRCCLHAATAKHRREDEEKQDRGRIGRIRQARDLEDITPGKRGRQNKPEAKSTPSNAVDEVEGASTVAPSRGHSYTIRPPWSRS
jgi:hypothetical protein